MFIKILIVFLSLLELFFIAIIFLNIRINIRGLLSQNRLFPGFVNKLK